MHALGQAARRHRPRDRQRPGQAADQRLDAGLEPLMRLTRDPRDASEAVNACVLAALTAEQLGWDDARGFDAGIAALLGPGLVRGIDEEALQLGHAAAAVASILGAAARPSDAIDRAERKLFNQSCETSSSTFALRSALRKGLTSLCCFFFCSESNRVSPRGIT